jgi:putative membrane protein
LLRRGSLLYWLAFSLLSGLAFTAWDLYLDPQMVAQELWRWQTPGGYFGIPWQNYLGWVVTSSLLTLLIRPAPLPRLPLLAIYGITWLFQAIGLGLFWGQPGPALAGFAGMGIFALSAGWTVRHEWKPFFGQLLPTFPAQSPTR